MRMRDKAMRIGVMSDTHLRAPDHVLERILEELFAGTDMILHAGDIVSRKVLDRLEEKSVLAVCGNMDDYEVADAIPQTRIFAAAGIRIAMIHGWGSKEGLEDRILRRFIGENPDLIVYGHSHVPYWGVVDGVHMFNPGAASQNRYTGTGTVGILEIRDKEMEATILPVER